jgi:hypothetical protein
MNSNRKTFLLVSGAFVLCLGLPNLAPAINNFAEELEIKQESKNQGGASGPAEKDAEAAKGITTIHGEVLQVEPDKYLIRKYDGDVVRLHIDNNKTQLSGSISQGDRIVAKVNEQEVVLMIQSAQ